MQKSTHLATRLLLLLNNLAHVAALAVGSNRAYAANYGSAAAVDQAAYESAEYWKQVAAEIPGFHDAPELKRYRGWVANLITKPPGELTTLETGQELLTQYAFPGLQGPESLARTAFPALDEIESALRDIAPIAQRELADLRAATPLADDDAPDASDAASDAAPDAAPDAAEQPWNRAAWYGWQFMSLRDAKPHMPETLRALEASCVPHAHRFVGIARQRAECRGTLHSDRRNYLLSTLLGLDVPTGGACGVSVPGHGERRLKNGEAVVLDNTFKHVVYNEAPKDRFVLMVEIWHPSLTVEEREALATTFAVKDRFTLTHLKQCPWGFSEAELTRAIESGAYRDVGFWRDFAHGL